LENSKPPETADKAYINISHESQPQCTNCGKLNEELAANQKIHKFDGTCREFCSQVCYQEFYSNPENKQPLQEPEAKIPAELSPSEMRFEESNASKFISEMDDDEIRNYIHVCLREIQRWRIHEKHARLGKAKLALDSDGNIIKAIREAKPKKARAEGKSPLTKAIESMAGLLGISFDEAKEIVEKQKGGG